MSLFVCCGRAPCAAMIALLAALSIFRDVRPDQAGFQPSWLYVALCLICPAVLGVLSALLITAIGKLVGRRSVGAGDG